MLEILKDRGSKFIVKTYQDSKSKKGVEVVGYEYEGLLMEVNITSPYSVSANIDGRVDIIPEDLFNENFYIIK